MKFLLIASQCPGGQIVPSSTETGELCINGMSFSNRDSVWANSALVVTVAADDPILEPYRKTHGALAGLEFQRDMERRAFTLGGGNMRAPVQRLTDFISERVSNSDIPSSSYRMGIKSAACHKIYPEPLNRALSDGIVNHFDKQMPGFLCDEALLHGVETRTSSPVRVPRDRITLQARGVENMFPAGEGKGIRPFKCAVGYKWGFASCFYSQLGAGFAGGIVSGKYNRHKK